MQGNNVSSSNGTHSKYNRVTVLKITYFSHKYGKKGIFIGYSNTSKAYRIYFPRFKKIDIGRDVTFDEDLTYFRSRRTLIQEVEEHEDMRVRYMEIR